MHYMSLVHAKDNKRLKPCRPFVGSPIHQITRDNEKAKKKTDSKENERLGKERDREIEIEKGEGQKGLRFGGCCCCNSHTQDPAITVVRCSRHQSCTALESSVSSATRPPATDASSVKAIVIRSFQTCSTQCHARSTVRSLTNQLSCCTISNYRDSIARTNMTTIWTTYVNMTLWIKL